MRISSKIAKWISRSRPRIYLTVLLLMILPVVFFAYSVDQALKEQIQKQVAVHAAAWAVGRRVWVLGAVFLGLAVGLAAFLSSLYKRLEMGNRFMSLSVDMFCVIGFDGYFKYVNPAAEKLLGFTRKELMAKPRIELIHPDDRAATLAEERRLRKWWGGAYYVLVAQVYRGEGRLCECLLSVLSDDPRSSLF